MLDSLHRVECAVEVVRVLQSVFAVFPFKRAFPTISNAQNVADTTALTFDHIHALYPPILFFIARPSLTAYTSFILHNALPGLHFLHLPLAHKRHGHP